MLKKKSIIITSLLVTSLVSYSVYANTNTSTSKQVVSKVNHEQINDQDKIKSSIPIKEEKPTADLGDLKEVDKYATHDTNDDPNCPKQSTNSYRIIKEYKSSLGKELRVVQGNSLDDTDITTRDIINKTGTRKVKGVNAVICEAEGGYTQVIFIKDKKFYNVMGLKMNKEELIQIAESLQ